MTGASLLCLLVVCMVVVCSAQNETLDTTKPSASLPITGSSCTLNADGSYSGPGSCEGFIQRMQVRYTNLTITNGGTRSSVVATKLTCQAVPWTRSFFTLTATLHNRKYGSYTCWANSAHQCGECKPGISGLEDPQLTCDVNDYCDDDGRCRSAKNSPLYGRPCPYEQGGLSKYGWCGPGLRCIGHECRICLEGVLDPTDGKRCVHGEWTYSAWVALEYNPNAIFQLCTLLLLGFYLIFLMFRFTPAWPITVRWSRKAGAFVAKQWKKIRLPTVSLPTVRKAKTPPATTKLPNRSTDPLADGSAVTTLANQSLELEEIENYLQANASLRED